MKKWKCTVCGQVFEGDAPPVPCPICNAGEEAFEAVASAETGRWKCTVCGQIFEGAVPPAPCPICNAGEEAFEPVGGVEEEAFRRDTGERFVLVGGGVACLEAAKAIRERNRTASIAIVCGEEALPYNRAGLTDVVGDGVSFVNLLLEEQTWYEAQKVDLLSGATVERLDRAAKRLYLSDGRELEYDRVLLATGAQPFNPVKSDADAVPVATLRTFEDAGKVVARASGKRVIVLGGGILGLEAAVALRERDAKVTVVQLEGRILPLQTDDEAAKRLTEAFHRQQIEVRTGVSLARVTSTGAILTDGTSLEADFVLVSVGVRADTRLAREAGVPVNRGIVVDDRMRTGAADVFAAGDCAEFEGKAPGQWSVAVSQGETAGAAMAGDEEKQYAPPVPAVAFETGGLKLFSAGTLQGEHLTEVVASTAEGAYRKLVFKEGKLIGALMLGDVSGSGMTIRLIEKGARLREAIELIGRLQ